MFQNGNAGMETETPSIEQQFDKTGWLLQELLDSETGGHKPTVAAASRVDSKPARPVPPQATPQFIPTAPKSWRDAGITQSQVQELVLRFLLKRSRPSGAEIVEQIRLPLPLIEELLRSMKSQDLVGYAGSSGQLGDFEYTLTTKGHEHAERYLRVSAYCESAPVPFEQYLEAIARQSAKNLRITQGDVHSAFSDLLLSDSVKMHLGRAMAGSRRLILYGPAGNGKTSIAERLGRTLGNEIWIPRALTIDGEVVRLFDPIQHQEVRWTGPGAKSHIDERWVCIQRPTIVVGGELTLDHLEVAEDKASRVLRAPLQLKSNLGTLVVDDLGRQRISVDELLNRWIVPMEKGFDFLSLPGGRKLQVPFDQVLVFSTNLDPSDLGDEAFLRRIPYKMRIGAPSEDVFRNLFRQTAESLGMAYRDDVVSQLIKKHYQSPGREFRFCHPRDFMTQLKSHCEFMELPLEMCDEYIDDVASVYFCDAVE